MSSSGSNGPRQAVNQLEITIPLTSDVSKHFVASFGLNVVLFKTHEIIETGISKYL